MQYKKHIENKRYVIGVIGDIPALLSFWQVFKDQSNEQVLKEIGVVAAALPGESVLPQAYDEERAIPTYSGFRTMLEEHPEINMVIESTGRIGLIHELRNYLPPSVTLVERHAANFFINLLTSDKIWVAAKLDLLHTQNMLKTIIDQMNNEMLFLDYEGKIVDMNKAVLDRTGLPKKAIMGNHYCEVFSTSGDYECEGGTDAFEKTIETSQPADMLISHVDGEGRVKYFRVDTTPITDEDGTVSHVVAVRRDITRRRAMEHRLQQAEKLASIGELSTYMAHEIRNPLFSISGFANALMRSDGVDYKAREKLAIILDESRRLDEILKSLMNFTRPTGAQVTEVDLNELVSVTMSIMRLPCTNQSVDQVLNLDKDLAKVNANPDLIKQCLINVIKNSLEAMENGGTLIVSTIMDKEHVILTVEDTGEGIPLDLRDKIFSPFFSSKGKGSGLGLAQTRKIVDEIGGTVDLTSVEGSGTKVTFFLPPILAVAEEKKTE
ncbi:two-component system sensor histidine kinase NtrB [Pseudodesulfovibrio sediminis]|uniref:histidine kinase n=1 Tax=Pseudodesulfovibrio sediminis TaxID=2810563 RepID=A0ABN6EUL7_9BACT|nr:ATP-binding protein [Pseudodesulfovibrio sediminis]BCS88736.1 PAS domain-containing sensor histidine kinase [Pseudodesulfovibrio sediminis]